MIPQLPPLAPIENWVPPAQVSYLGAIGFEDRSTAALEWLRDSGRTVASCQLFAYDPPSGKNRTNETIQLAKQVSRGEHPRTHEFRRFTAESFLAVERSWAELESEGLPIVVDLTSMSKYLILATLWAARNFDGPVTFTYHKPQHYSPTEAEFKKYQGGAMQENGDAIPPLQSFLIGGGSPHVLSSPWLSSVTFDDQPVHLVAFANFDLSLLTAPIEDLTPKTLLIIEPGEDAPSWWRDALSMVNAQVYESTEFLRVEREAIAIYDPQALLEVLERSYEENGLKCRVVVSPTGSKLHAFATFFFKVLHPDVEIVYPAPIAHTANITEGVGAGYVLRFDSFSRALDEFRSVRSRSARDLVGALRRRLNQE